MRHLLPSTHSSSFLKLSPKLYSFFIVPKKSALNSLLGWPVSHTNPLVSRSSFLLFSSHDILPIPYARIFPYHFLFAVGLSPAIICFGSMGIARMRKKIGGVGRASPTQHPHIFSYFPAIPNEPICFFFCFRGSNTGSVLTIPRKSRININKVMHSSWHIQKLYRYKDPGADI